MRFILLSIALVAISLNTSCYSQENVVSQLQQSRPMVRAEIMLCALQASNANKAHLIAGRFFWSPYDEAAKKCREELKSGLRKSVDIMKDSLKGTDKLEAAKAFFVNTNSLVSELETNPDAYTKIQQRMMQEFDVLISTIEF